jgi:hypothetical protein
MLNHPIAYCPRTLPSITGTGGCCGTAAAAAATQAAPRLQPEAVHGITEDTVSLSYFSNVCKSRGLGDQ